jgi:hypothetical protein
MGFAGQPVVPDSMATDDAVAPQSLPYYAAPGPAVQVPGVRACTYVYVNGRTLLIDPVTNAVVGELN